MALTAPRTRDTWAQPSALSSAPKHLHPAHAPSNSSTASPGKLCLPKPAAPQLNHPTLACATFSQGGPPCCRQLLPLSLLLALQGASAGLSAATQPSSEHVNNMAGCVLVKRGNFGWEMWGPEQDARVSSVTVSGYKQLEGNKAKVMLLTKSERK